MTLRVRFTCLVVCAFLGPAALADEGMWLINRPPTELLKQRYAFEPDAAWLEHVQKSAVRFGASGSFVSPDGLLLTNHHVASGAIERLSTAERNLVRDGFVARTREEELRCPGAEAKVLWSIEDVTARVNRVAAELPPGEASDARQAEMTRIEDESKAQTGLHSEVVTLYHGARYHLYRYKRFDDVRLVWAPESGVGFFGGDVDNFEYPRFALDAALLRVYEDGKPVRPEHYLRWSTDGVGEGELVFAIGHPGSTSRLFTVEQFRFERDELLPRILQHIFRRETRLSIFRSRSEEFARIGFGKFLGTQNWRKSQLGAYETLLDPAVMTAKQADEDRLRAWVAADPQRQALYGDAWDKLAAAQPVHAELAMRLRLLERWVPYESKLLDIGRGLVRLAAELPKPSAERLRGYGDSDLPSLYLDLYSTAPIYDALEIEMISSWLMSLAEAYGADDPLVKRLLDGQPPRRRAEAIVRGTLLKDVEARRALAEGGAAAIEASRDPAIVFVRLFDEEARAVRQRYEREVEAVEQAAHARIAAARFAMNGEGSPPDATGTLRLAYGTVKGYEEGGQPVPAFTTYAGLYARAEARRHQPPFDLPPRWVEKRSALNLGTPLNFVATLDIVGGNSGSPVVNRAGELVGLVFDGNLQSLAWDYLYDERQGRALAVDARAILEALRSVYEAEHLVREILGSPRAAESR